MRASKNLCTFNCFDIEQNIPQINKIYTSLDFPAHKEYENIISENQPHIIIGCESHLDDTYPTAEYFLMISL